MASKERFQNPTVGDTVKLRLYVWNANNAADLNSIEQIDIYFLDPTNTSEANPDGRVLLDTFDSTAVTLEETGAYVLELPLETSKYSIGRFIDVWTVTINDQTPAHPIQQCFDIFPQLWYTSPMPVVYDFSFHFQPNKLRQGSIQPLLIEIKPNVPTASDLQRYYQNLAIVSDLKISIEQACGNCLPDEQDLRLIVDKELVQSREKRYGYYKLDTTEMDCGIYNVWFQLEFGGNVYISDRMQLQIYE